MARDDKCAPTKTPADHIWLTSDDAAELLRISRRALYHRVERGQLPVHRLGRCYRFNRREIEAALLLSPPVSDN
jgi:excisionase family DNA binding protein